jgi:ribonuclease HI
MHTSLPHYLLHAETYRSGRGAPRWKFALQSVGSEEKLSAADSEPTTRRSRLELLAVVRGLEALDRPTRVTLLTRSRYVSRGIRRQLAHWREHHWQWEKFGEMTLIRDYDLWRRVDRALQIHSVECCVWQAEESTAKTRETHHTPSVWSVAATLGRLSRGVLTPLAGLLPPSFTRAA